MIIASPSDYRAAARRKLPRFLFDYIDGGAYAEHTLRANVADLTQVALKQRILKNVESLTLDCELFGQKLSMPVILAPVGLTGMYARRGEIAGGEGSRLKGIPYSLSTVSVCPIEGGRAGNSTRRSGFSSTC